MKVGAEMEVEQCRNESRCSQTHLKRIPVIDPRNTPDCGKRCTASLSVRKVRFQPKNEGRNRAKSGEIGPKMGQKGLTARPLPSRLRKRAKFSQNAGRNSEFTGIRNRCTASPGGFRWLIEHRVQAMPPMHSGHRFRLGSHFLLPRVTSATVLLINPSI